MTYMKKGAMIRPVEDRDMPRFAAMGFVPMERPDVKPAKKSVRRRKEENPNGNA